jgi:hypothetical protein
MFEITMNLNPSEQTPASYRSKKTPEIAKCVPDKKDTYIR